MRVCLHFFVVWDVLLMIYSCVVAGRLANLDHNLQVMLIEAGESNLNNPWVYRPGIYPRNMRVPSIYTEKYRVLTSSSGSLTVRRLHSTTLDPPNGWVDVVPWCLVLTSLAEVLPSTSW
jgi:hypothetical protein